MRLEVMSGCVLGPALPLVASFDAGHGQDGVAPNAIELHPMLGFGCLYAPGDPGENPRHVRTLEPLWNLLDLTPEGRPPDWYEQLSYA